MVIVTLTENFGTEFAKRTFQTPEQAFEWLGSSRYKWEQVSPTECVSAKRPDCKAIIGGDF